MRRIRLFVLAIASFLTVTCGSFLQRAIALTMCGILGINSPACYLLGNRVNAAVPPVSSNATIIAQNIDIFSPDGGGTSSPPPNDIFSPPNPQTPPPSGGDDIFAPPNSQNNPRNQNNQNISDPPSSSPINLQQAATNIKQISSTTIEGCLITVNTKILNGKAFTDSIEFVAKDEESCGTSFKSKFSPDNNSIEITNSQGEKSILEKIDSQSFKITYTDTSNKDIQIKFEIISAKQVRLTYPDYSGKITVSTFEIPDAIEIPTSILSSAKNLQLVAHKSNLAASSKLPYQRGIALENSLLLSQSKFDPCKEFKESCKSLDEASDLVGTAEAVTTLTGIAAIPVIGQVIEGTLAGLDTALSFTRIPCFVAYGGDPPIPFSKAIKVAGKGLRVAGKIGDSRNVRMAGIQASKFAKRIENIENKIDDLQHGTSDEKVKAAQDLADKFYEDKQDEETTWTDKIRDKLGLSAPCKDKEDKNDIATQPTSRPQTGQLTKGTSYGDPHMITFDGFKYSFQTVGEFTLVKSTNGNFEVQARQGSISNSVSMNTAVAMKIGNSRVALYAKNLPDSDTSTPLRVDGKPTKLENGTLELPGGGTIQGNSSYYLITAPTGEQIGVKMGNGRMDITPYISGESGQYIGLLGNANGDPADDLQTRSGKVIPTKENSTYGLISEALSNLLPVPAPLSQAEKIFFDIVYKEFGDSWRISQAESLFNYPPGKDTGTFTNRSFPNSYLSLNSLLPPQIRKAEEICRQAGVESELMDGCIFDVANTGDASFAESAANALLDTAKDRLLQQLRNKIPSVPIRIPGLPF